MTAATLKSGLSLIKQLQQQLLDNLGDKDSDQNGIHANFKISAAGEALFLHMIVYQLLIQLRS